jgi:hypothetical protein
MPRDEADKSPFPERSSGSLCVGVIQSSYIPWRGYFDFINSVDAFVIYDDVQYSTGSWRNRNKVKTASGLRWITVPVQKKLGLAIDEVRIGSSNKPWKEEHRRLLRESLGPARFSRTALELWEEGVSGDHLTISALNVMLIQGICRFLGIATPILNSRDFALSGAATERLIELLTKLGATKYLSGPAAKAYLEPSLFRRNNIALAYKSYDYEPYSQLWGPFVGEVTILDLIANMGPDARRFLKSKTPDIPVVDL